MITVLMTIPQIDSDSVPQLQCNFDKLPPGAKTHKKITAWSGTFKYNDYDRYTDTYRSNTTMFKSIFTLAFAMLILPFQAHALGLGEMQVDSSLYQRFEAHIDLISTTPEDAETVIAKLASRAEFQKKEINRPMALTNLKFRVVVENDKTYIKITSASIIREPIMHFLLDVDWPEGRFLREYRAVLVPPKVL